MRELLAVCIDVTVLSSIGSGSLTIETCTAEIASSEAAEAGAKVSESELRQLFPGQFRAIAHGLIKVRITALADGSLIAKQIGKSDTGTWNIRSGQCEGYKNFIDPVPPFRVVARLTQQPLGEIS